MNKEKITAIFWEKLTGWETGPERMSSGYAYEKSYVTMIKEVEAEVFKTILEEEDVSGDKKNFIQH
jgi:hypothetical protein